MSDEVSNHKGSNKSLVSTARVPVQEDRERAEGEEVINLMDYWRVIVRQRWAIITTLVVITVAVTISTFRTRPVYQATTTLRISREAPKVLSFEDVVKTGGVTVRDFYNTQYEIIRSRTLAENVIKRLNLGKHPEFMPDDNNFSLIGSIKSTLRAWLSKAISSSSSSKTPTVGRWDKDFKRSALVNSFLGRIEVQPLRYSELVRVCANTYYPDLSALIANTLAVEYIQQSLQSKAMTTVEASGQLSEQLLELKGRLEESEIALYKYCEENKIVALDEKENVLHESLKMISERSDDAKVKRIEIETLYTLLKNSDHESIPAIIESPSIDELEAQYYSAQAEYFFERGRLKPNHPDARRLQQRMERIKKTIYDKFTNYMEGLELKYQQALVEEEKFSNEFNELKKEMLVIARKIVPYKSLKREVDANTELYNGLLQRMKEAGISSEINTTNVQIVDRAEIPMSPFKPNKKRNILLGMIVSLICGTGLAFLIEYLDNTVKSPDDVENRIRLPLLGFVPAIEEKKTREGDGHSKVHHGDDGNNGSVLKDLVAHNESRSSASEAYRTIRTGVIFSSPDRKVHSILVTSAYPSEGKTVTATNLATVLAQGGRFGVAYRC